MPNGVVVKLVPRRPFFDIFVGKGWRNWTRVHRDRNGNLTIIAGLQLDIPFINDAIKAYFQQEKELAKVS